MPSSESPKRAAAADALAAIGPTPGAASRPAHAGKAHAGIGDVVLLAALSAMGSISMDMYLPALPVLTRALGTTPAAAQQTVVVFLVGLALGQLVFGPLSDRIGRRPPIVWGLGVYLLAGAACAWAPTVHLLVLARLLQALGACAGMVVARAVVRDRYEDHEVLHIFSMLSLVFGVAPILAPLIGGWVLGVAGWRWIFGMQALFAAAIGLWSFLTLPESRSEATRLQARAERPWASYLALLGNLRLVGFLATGSLSMAALFAYITAAPEIVISLYKISASHFGWIFGINAAGLIGAGQLNARLARRVESGRILRTALWTGWIAGAVLLVVALSGRGGLLALLVPLFVVISSTGFTQTNATASAMMVDRTRAGAVAALLGAAMFIVGSFAGLATGWLHDGSAKPLALVTFASMSLSLAALYTLVRPNAPAAARPAPE